MDIIEAINTRKSIRAFKPDPVPKTVLEEMLKVATRAPSGINAQPWEFVIVAGEALKKLCEANIARFNAREAVAWDMSGKSPPAPLPSVYRERAIGLQAQLQALMNFTREDREKRAEWSRLGFRYFGAPAAIIITMDKALNTSSFFDIGLVTQTIALAALNYGLGTCIQGQGIMYPKTVREITGIPESKHLVISIAIGYPDWSHPANRIHSDREPLDKITTWLGFEQ